MLYELLTEILQTYFMHIVMCKTIQNTVYSVA